MMTKAGGTPRQPFRGAAVGNAVEEDSGSRTLLDTSHGSSSLLFGATSCWWNRSVYSVVGNRIIGRDAHGEETQAPLLEIVLRKRATCLAVATKQAALWIGHEDGFISIISAVTHAALGELVLHEAAVTQLMELPDSSTVASIGSDGRLVLWDVYSYQMVVCVKASEEPLTTMARITVTSGGDRNDTLHQPPRYSFLLGTALGSVLRISVDERGPTLLQTLAILPTRKSVTSICLTTMTEDAGNGRGSHKWMFASSGMDVYAFDEWWTSGTAASALPPGALPPLVQPRHAVALDGDVRKLWSRCGRLFAWTPHRVVEILPHPSGSALRCRTAASLDGDDRSRGAFFLPSTYVKMCLLIGVRLKFVDIEIPDDDAAAPLVDDSHPPRTGGTTSTSSAAAAHVRQSIVDHCNDLQGEVQKLRAENQKLRDQLQVLLRAPLLQKSVVTAASGSTGHSVAVGGESVVALEKQLRKLQSERDSLADELERASVNRLENLRECYQSSIRILESAESSSRSDLRSMELEARQQSSYWFSCLQRSLSTHDETLDIRRRYHQTVAELHANQDRVSMLERDVATAEQQLQRRSKECETREEDCLALQRKVEQLQHELVLRDARVEGFEQEIRSAEREMEAYRRESDAAATRLREQTRAHDISTRNLQAEVDALRLERQDLSQRLTELSTALENASLRATRAEAAERTTLERFTAIEAHLEQLQQHQATSDAANRLSDAVQQTSVERERAWRAESPHRVLEAEKQSQLIRSLTEERDQALAQASELTKRLNRRKQASTEANDMHLRVLQEELAAARSAVSRTVEERDDFQSERDQIQLQLDAQKSAMRQELTRMHAEIQLLQQFASNAPVHQENILLEERNRALNARLQAQEQQLHDATQHARQQREALEDRILDLTTKLRKAEESVAQSRRELEAADARRLQAEAQAESNYAALETELASSRDQLSRWRLAQEQSAKLSNERAQQREADLESAQAELGALRHRLSATEREVQHWKAAAEHKELLASAELAASQRRQEELMEQLRSETEDHRIARDELRKQLAAARSTEHATLQALVDELAQQRDTTNAKLREEQQRCATLVAETEEKMHRIEAELRRTKRQHEEAVSSLELQLQKAQREIKQQAADHVRQLAEAVGSKTDQAAAAVAEVDELKRALGAAQAKSAALEASSASERDELHRIRVQLRAAVTELRQLNDDAQAKEAVHARVAQDAEIAKVELERAVKMCGDLSRRNALHQAEAEDLRAQLEDVTRRSREREREAEFLAERAKEHQLEKDQANAQLAQEAAHTKAQLQVQTTLAEELRAQLAQALERSRQCEEALAGARRSLGEEAETLREDYSSAVRETQQFRLKLEELEGKHRVVVANLHAAELSHRSRIEELLALVATLQRQLHGDVATWPSAASGVASTPSGPKLMFGSRSGGTPQFPPTALPFWAGAPSPGAPDVSHITATPEAHTQPLRQRAALAPQQRTASIPSRSVSSTAAPGSAAFDRLWRVGPHAPADTAALSQPTDLGAMAVAHSSVAYDTKPQSTSLSPQW